MMDSTAAWHQVTGVARVLLAGLRQVLDDVLQVTAVVSHYHAAVIVVWQTWYVRFAHMGPKQIRSSRPGTSLL
jgi:hypothetical protein